jgi:enoyl-CoA hydratase/carnithine racemase
MEWEEVVRMATSEARLVNQNNDVPLEHCLHLIRIPINHYNILTNIRKGEKLLNRLDDIEEDDRVRVILFINEPGAYSEENYRQYHDKKMTQSMKDLNDEPISITRLIRAREMHILQRYITRRMQSNKLHIDCLQGEIISPFIGGSLAADLRFASEDARLVFSHTKNGPYVDGGLPFFLQRYVGHSKALQIMLNRQEMDVEEAYSLRLVDRIFPADNFKQSCVEEARKLCSHDAEDLHIMKQLFYHFSDELNRIFSLETSLIE